MPHKPPPSRLRYEKSHPAVTFRVTTDELEKLRAMSTKTGLSLSQILKRGLGVLENKLEEAYNKGFEDGWGRFEAPCNICSEPMLFDIKEEEKPKAILEKAFSDWCHTACKEAQP